jgi:hypothetical protein
MCVSSVKDSTNISAMGNLRTCLSCNRISAVRNICLQELHEFANYFKDIVASFKNHHTNNDMLKVAQKNAKPQCRVLVLPDQKRKGTLEGFKTGLMSENLIHVIIAAREFISSAPVNKQETLLQIDGIVTEPDFVFNLEPIDRIDTIPVSDVHDSFLRLPSQLVIAEMRESFNTE